METVNAKQTNKQVKTPQPPAGTCSCHSAKALVNHRSEHQSSVTDRSRRVSCRLRATAPISGEGGGQARESTYLPVSAPQPLLRHREAGLGEDALLEVPRGRGGRHRHGPAAHAAAEHGHADPPATGKGMVSGVRARPAGPPSLPGSRSPVPHGGLPRPAGRRLTPSPAAPPGPPPALTRGSSWRRPAPPQRSAAARSRGRGRRRCGGGASPGAPRAPDRQGPGGRGPRARAAPGPLAGERLLRAATPSQTLPEGRYCSWRSLRPRLSPAHLPGGPRTAPPPPSGHAPSSQTHPADCGCSETQAPPWLRPSSGRLRTAPRPSPSRAPPGSVRRLQPF